jgi:DNA-directed RNA polymerase specialized sigma24 family protein
MTAADPSQVTGRPIHVSDTLTAATAADRNAVHATTALYTAHYRSLVGLAVLLVRDMSTAEEIVQESFVAMHTNWRRLRDSGKALWYVRSVWSIGLAR